MILAALALLAAAASADLTTTLRAQSQALVDAVSHGDRAVWDRLMAPGALYADESGGVSTRAQMLDQVTPLPPGVSGHIDVDDDYQVTASGDDVAVAVFHLNEFETFHGQQLRARYLMTETWVRRDGAWRLLAAHCYAGLKPPPAVALPAARLDDYAGRYAAGPDLAYVIVREGDHLMGGREGKPAKPLTIEVADVLFDPDALRTRKIFRRDGAGRVIGFVDRREGEDIVWTRQP